MANALKLPLEVRADLATKLIHSLDEDANGVNYEAEWADETERRLDAYDRGEMEAYSVKEVMNEYYNRAKKSSVYKRCTARFIYHWQAV